MISPLTTIPPSLMLWGTNSLIRVLNCSSSAGLHCLSGMGVLWDGDNSSSSSMKSAWVQNVMINSVLAVDDLEDPAAGGGALYFALSEGVLALAGDGDAGGVW